MVIREGVVMRIRMDTCPLHIRGLIINQVSASFETNFSRPAMSPDASVRKRAGPREAVHVS